MDSYNKLSGETSPYLQQHASNPVNWYPWSQEAIDFARKQDKPILLSIGYSACHWCHVMNDQCFNDPDIASTMNRLFVNVIVDKEQRPDLDKIYQTCYQLLMGTYGGWPLTLFISPYTLIPYFGGTYFPRDGQDKTPNFKKILDNLNDIFYHEKDKIKQQEAHIGAVLQIINQPRAASQMPLAAELNQEAFGILEQDFDARNGGFGQEAKFPCSPTLDFILNSPEPLVRHMAISTLEIMATRNIHDHKHGGFYRYTTDQKWQDPHTEKMLYDNAQLLGLYAQASVSTGKELFRQIAIETGHWLLDTLRDSQTNALYCSVDADSSAIDIKILSGWNGLAIKGLAQAGKLLAYPPFLQAAEKIADYLEVHGEYRFLEDYAFVIGGLLELGQPKYKKMAEKLADEMIDKFYDHEYGGFYFTANDQPVVVYRPKFYVDEAVPSGNGIACLALLEMGKVDLVKATMHNAQAFLNEAPELHPTMLKAYGLLHANHHATT